VLGTGVAAKAVAAALDDAGPEVVVRGRRDPGWPPSAEGFDVLVNETPVKGQLVVDPRAGMQVGDLAYRPDGRPTALFAAARILDCHPCVDGLDVLLAQGEASFECWTGEAAPLARCGPRSVARRAHQRVRRPASISDHRPGILRR